MQEEHVAVADGENEVRHTDYIYIYINFATIICYDVFNDMGC